MRRQRELAAHLSLGGAEARELDLELEGALLGLLELESVSGVDFLDAGGREQL